MSSVLDIFTKFINSPGGVLTAGAALAGIVWKFFERVEAVLTDQTRLQVAIWLLGVKVSHYYEHLPNVAAKIAHDVFGSARISNRRYTIYLMFACSFGLANVWLSGQQLGTVADLFLWLIMECIVLNASLWEARFVRRKLGDTASSLRWFSLLSLNLAGDLLATMFLLGCGLWVLNLHSIPSALYPNFVLTEIATQSWHLGLGLLPSVVIVLMPQSLFWLYAGSGFLLKVARRFDIGFEWFNCTFGKHLMNPSGA